MSRLMSVVECADECADECPDECADECADKAGSLILLIEDITRYFLSKHMYALSLIYSSIRCAD